MDSQTFEVSLDDHPIKDSGRGSSLLDKEIAEGQTELIFRFDPDLKLTFVNNSCCHIWGMQPRELIGQNLMRFIYEEDREAIKKMIASLKKGNPVASLEHRMNSGNGDVRWYQLVSQAIFDDHGSLSEYQAVGHVFTSRILTEKALLDEKERYRLLISRMSHGFALFDIIMGNHGDPVDGRFVKVNAAFESITGMKQRDVVNKTITQVLSESVPSWIHTCAKVALTGEPIQFREYFKKFDKDLEVLAYSPSRGQFATVFTDISRRVQMEASLRESESNFRALADNANDGILIAVEGGKLVYINRRVCEISGYSIAELTMLTLMDLAHPEESAKIYRRHQKRLEGKPVPARYETILEKKDGKTVPIEITDSLTHWQGENAVLRIIRDITLRKQAESALGNIHNELEAQVKQRTSELMIAADKLDEKQRELLRHKIDLEKANKELVQTNTALSVLARNIDKKRDEIEKKMAQAVSSQILPLVEELKNDSIPEKSLAKLEVLSAYLSDLTSGASKSHDIIVSLSPMELRVAVMIKNGFKSEDIARLLHISIDTVKTHRRSIRRKLKLRNSDINLTSYLKFKLGKISGSH